MHHRLSYDVAQYSGIQREGRRTVEAELATVMNELELLSSAIWQMWGAVNWLESFGIDLVMGWTGCS